jgi:hypothetical protein
MLSSIPRRLTLFILFVCVVVGCTFTGPTRLCGSFRSYQTLDEVKADLATKGLIAGWKQSSQGTPPGDRRPPYKITYLSGPFKLSGIDGYLKFTFYNGLLMETQFSTEKGAEYLTVLRRENYKAPTTAAQEIVTDRRTRLRFDSGPNGTTVFTWYDPKLEKQWRNWVASNS